MIPFHLIGVTALFTWINYLPQSLLYLPFALIFWALFAGCGIGVGFHRYFAHKSFKTKRWIGRLFAYFGSLGMQGSPAFWVSLHRGYHHRYSDTEKDIHSPIHGKLNSYFGWMLTVDESNMSIRYAGEMLRDRFQVWIHENYFLVVWATFIIVALLSWKLALFALVPAMLVTFHQEMFVNCFLHNKSWGYRNFDTDDNSVNVYWYGLIFWGIGFHNNHHAKPNDYNFGHKPEEIDLCKYIVRLVEVSD